MRNPSKTSAVPTETLICTLTTDSPVYQRHEETFFKFACEPSDLSKRLIPCTDYSADTFRKEKNPY